MNIALLVRGFHQLHADRFGFPLDARRHLNSLVDKVIEPLVARHRVAVYCVTYDSPIWPDVRRQLDPVAVALCDPSRSGQIATFRRGLALVRDDPRGFDRIICTRFDLRYLLPVDRWNIWDRRGLFFPWREYEHLWFQERRVSDMIHVCDSAWLEPFDRGLAKLESAGKKEMHLLYSALGEVSGDLHFICEDFYDSNTLFWNRECRNPIFQLGNRPRLPAVETVRQPCATSSLPVRVWRRGYSSFVRRWREFVVAAAAWIARSANQILPLPRPRTVRTGVGGDASNR